MRQPASIQFTQSHSMIQRFDLERTALVKADLEKWANLDRVMAPVLNQLKSYPFPNGYHYIISGNTFSFSAFIGLICLVCIVVNNSIMGGLLASTFLTLIIVPVLYLVFTKTAPLIKETV